VASQENFGVKRLALIFVSSDEQQSRIRDC
jgi:hypothetical protein